MQLIGMILLPLAIVANISPTDPVDLKTSLTMPGVGVLIFGLGWLIQQAGKPQG
jgi:hypothetical protein